MAAQLEIPLTTPPSNPCWADQALQIARAAINTDRVPGYSCFTTGTVNVNRYTDDHIVLATDNRWAASTIRTALLDTGHAIDGDPTNESTTVTVWAIRQANTYPAPLLDIADEASHPDRPGFLLNGPDGCVEQQCGAADHNHLIAHASHPFPGSARGACDRHNDPCWQRWSWPLAERARHLLDSSHTETGMAVWRLTSEAGQRMQDLYLTHIHSTRP